jgi:hypothetical protein
MHCTARPGRFWEVVAKRVASRNAQECYNKWLLLFSHQDSLVSKSSKPAGESKNQASKKTNNKLSGKLAGKNTARYRKQVRNIFQASESLMSTDDAFHSTPFQKKKAASRSESFAFATNIATPTAPHGDSDARSSSSSSDGARSIKGGSSSEDEDMSAEHESIDRDKADYYIVGMAKRRKGGKEVGLGRSSRGGHTQLQATRANESVSASSDGVKGTLLPNGSVKIQYDKAHFAYEWSDGSEGEDEDLA